VKLIVKAALSKQSFERAAVYKLLTQFIYRLNNFVSNSVYPKGNFPAKTGMV
jgi:hypothetical protein